MADKEFKIYKKNDGNPVRDETTNTDTTLTITYNDDNCEVKWKSLEKITFPQHDRQIRWFNNFSVINKKTKQELKKADKFSYTVTIEEPPANTTLYVYNQEEDKIIDISSNKTQYNYTTSNKKATFTLDFGDPPTGFFP